MTKIRNLLLTVATSAACVALVSDVHGMRTLQQKLQAMNARAPVAVPVVANQVEADFAMRHPVILPLLDADDAVDGARLGGGTDMVRGLKRAFNDGLVGVAAELIATMQSGPRPLGTGVAVVDNDIIVAPAEAGVLHGLIVALEQGANTSMDNAGAQVARPMDASYADFVALLEHDAAGDHTGTTHGILHDGAGVLADDARREALLNHILDAGTHIDTYITDFTGAGNAHAGFAGIRATLGGGAAAYDADFGVDRIARWHLGRLVFEEHVATGLTFKAIRALAKIFRGL